jgi:SM-20-related protein
LSYLTTSDLEKLDTQGFVIKDGFLKDAALLQSIRDEVEQMKETGGLKLAGMNQGQEQWRDKNIRGDLHAWVNDIERVSLQLPNLGSLLRKMDSIRVEMNEVCGFDSPKCQTQVACYPGEGARYVRHLDAFIGGANRRITVLFCTLTILKIFNFAQERCIDVSMIDLNENWKKEDDGCLRAFLPKTPTLPGGEDDEESFDIEPIADRILIFQSRTIEHEVLPSHAQRFSITTWFY